MKKHEAPYEIQLFEGIGPFKLNTHIDNYPNFKFAFYSIDDVTGWETYELNDSFSIYTDNQIIVSIACRTLCTLNGVFIVNGRYSNFLEKFSPSKITYDQIYMPEDDGYQDVYDIDDLGLQLWCKYDVIVTVFCAAE